MQQTAYVPHGNLILKTFRGRIGVWQLKDRRWARKPFTGDVSKARACLATMRLREARKKAKAEEAATGNAMFLNAFAAIVFAYMLGHFVLGIV